MRSIVGRRMGRQPHSSPANAPGEASSPPAAQRSLEPGASPAIAVLTTSSGR